MTQTGEAAGTAKIEQRTSHRVHCSMPLQLAGVDSSGRNFTASSRTEVITRDGGMIITAVSLTIGSQIRLLLDEKSATARIVGMVGIRDEEMAYGIHIFSTSGAAFWGVQFPTTPDMSGAGRTVLECSRCATRRLSELSEVEMMVLENIGVVNLACGRCGNETPWHIPAQVIEVELVSSGADVSKPAVPPAAPRTGNERKHARIAMKNTRACIRRLGMKDEVVDVVDISRGGVRFRTFADYQDMTYLEVAVPYTEGGANVFVPARIVRVGNHPRRPDTKGEFACRYEKRS
ncbi:MAG: PilZ domain-containing protein [Terriglobales bacterium]